MCSPSFHQSSPFIFKLLATNSTKNYWKIYYSIRQRVAGSAQRGDRRVFLCFSQLFFRFVNIDHTDNFTEKTKKKTKKRRHLLFTFICTSYNVGGMEENRRTSTIFRRANKTMAELRKAMEKMLNRQKYMFPFDRPSACVCCVKCELVKHIVIIHKQQRWQQRIAPKSTNRTWA